MTDGCLPLAIELPGEIMAQLEEAAKAELRTPEAQALWLIRDGLGRMGARVATGKTRQERLRDAGLLRSQLTDAIVAKGRPSHREIARAAETRGYSISHTTVSEIMRGAHFPTWQLVEAIAFALDTSPDKFRAAWEKAAR
jgi:transcriptional regulator with XRE-family HTH domain